VTDPKAHDVAYVRFAAPDLDRMRVFLEDFGLVVAERSTARLVMRGHGDRPVCHVTELGEPAFLAAGIWMRDAGDLTRLAEREGVAVEPLDLPGGGQVVRLADPDGFRIEAVAGQAAVAPLPVSVPPAWNQGLAYPRQSRTRRVAQGPSHVLRLGHIVLGVSDFRRSERWYKDRFGLVTSDEIQPMPGKGIGAFLRCDRGEEPCDHHTLFLLERPAPPGFMHMAFEVLDVDDLMAGHDHLQAKDYNHLWGVGRHYLGSQIFDYWLDPWGNEIEHWTDGDRFVAADGGGIGSVQQLMGVQWGMDMPPIAAPGEQD